MEIEKVATMEKDQNVLVVELEWVNTKLVDY